MGLTVNPFLDAAGADDVKGGVTSLKLGLMGGKKMNVSGVSKPLEMIISRKGGPINSTKNCVHHQDMVYHSINITKNHSSLQVIINPAVNFTGKVVKPPIIQFVVYVKRGSRPTKEKYDFSKSLPDLSLIETSPSNTTEMVLNPNLMLISNEKLNRTAAGVWFVGVLYNTTLEVEKLAFTEQTDLKTEEERKEELPLSEVCYELFIFASACVFLNTTSNSFSTAGMWVSK